MCGASVCECVDSCGGECLLECVYVCVCRCVCLCVCVCLFVCVYEWVCVYVFEWAHVCVDACVVRVCLWEHVGARVLVHLCGCVGVGAFVGVGVWVRVCLRWRVRGGVCVGSRVNAFVRECVCGGCVCVCACVGA